MKKTLVSLSLALAFSSPTFADSDKIQPTWLAGFAEYYRADNDKFPNSTSALDGTGLGFEVGVGFSPKWAGRIEWADLDLDGDNNYSAGGFRLGADVLYFPNAGSEYLFAGWKRQEIEQNMNVFSVGLGNRWTITDNIKFITEVGAAAGSSSNYNDINVKLGVAYLFGDQSSTYTPRDDDNDGVVNTLDQCPNTPAGQRVDKKGCPLDLDDDNDGVLNSNDKCPGTPAGTKVDETGCALMVKAIGDADQDGVTDDMYQCANTPINDKVDEVGCSLFAEKKIPIELNVLFANNSSKVNNPDDESIVKFAQALKDYPEIEVTIEGHSSAPGNADYNQKLSEERANNVRQLLIDQYAIPASQLSAIGYGETRLLDTSNTEAAHNKNRRIVATATAITQSKVQK